MADIRFNQNGEAVELRDNEWVPVRRARNPETGAHVYFYNGEWRNRDELAAGGPAYGSGSNLPQRQETAQSSSFITRGDVPQAVEAAVAQAAPGFVQTPLAAANLVSRLWPGNYEGEGADRFIPGSGAYDAPLPTREEVMGGIYRRTGDERYVHGARTPVGRVTQAAVGAGVEGLGVSAVARGGPVAFRAGRTGRLPTATEAGFAGRDITALTLTDAAAAGSGAAATEVSGNPWVGLGVGALTGQVGGSMFFGRGPQGDVRRVMSDVTEDEIRYARTIMDAAEREGITLTGMDAVALASATSGPELVQLYRQAVNILGERDPAATVRRGNVGTGRRGREVDTGEFGAAMRRFQEESLGVRGRPDQEQTAIRTQEAASASVRQAREEARRVYGPLYEQLESVALPTVNRNGNARNFIEVAQENMLDRAYRAFGPNTPEMAQVERLVSELDDIRSVAQFDNWRRGFYRRTSTNNPGTPDQVATEIGGVLGREMAVLDRYLSIRNDTYRNARQQYARTQQEIVDPVVRAVGAIADRDGQRAARYVVRTIIEDTDMEPETLRRGFDAISEQNPEAARELLSMYLQRQFDTAFQANAGAGGRPRTTAGGDWHARMFKDENNIQNLEHMFNTVDSSRGLPEGTTFTAFSRLMDLAQASGQNRGAGSSGIGPAMNESLESGRLGGTSVQFATDMTNIPVVGNLIGRRIALAMYRGDLDHIVDQLTRTGPGAVDNVLRLAESRYGSRAMMQASIPFTVGANVQEAATAREEQQ